LRHESDQRPDVAARPGDLTTLRLPLDDPADTEFWSRWGGGLDCTPLYYRAFLDRNPDRIARVVEAVADAPAGGVFVHCAGGRDRTGLIVLVLLALGGVPAEDIAADYELSAPRLAPAWQARGRSDETSRITELIASHGTTARQAVIDTVNSIDARAYLRRAGLPDPCMSAVQARLLEAPVTGRFTDRSAGCLDRPRLPQTHPAQDGCWAHERRGSRP
jgi:hypothetical protein